MMDVFAAVVSLQDTRPAFLAELVHDELVSEKYSVDLFQQVRRQDDQALRTFSNLARVVSLDQEVVELVRQWNVQLDDIIRDFKQLASRGVQSEVFQDCSEWINEVFVGREKRLYNVSFLVDLDEQRLVRAQL